MNRCASRPRGVGTLCLTLVILALTGGCRTEHYTALLATGDEVRFVRAIKGNDLVVEKQGQLARVRLVGVYTFDPNVREKSDIEVWAKNAAGFIARAGHERPLRVVLELEKLDPKGRHLGFLEADGVDLGRALIEEGHGAAYTEYPFSREVDYLAVEAKARASVRGVWGGKTGGKRLHALRETWATMRKRELGAPFADPLFTTERK